MKILKHGDLKLRKFRCRTCDCEFVANRDEYGSYSIYRPDTLEDIEVCRVYCPDCGTFIEQDAPLYKEPVDEHVATACDALLDVYETKQKLLKSRQEMLDDLFVELTKRYEERRKTT